MIKKEYLATFAVLALLLGVLSLMQDAAGLNSLVRLHVVAQSDSAYDQSGKLLVRDGIWDYLQPRLSGLAPAEARKRIADELPGLQALAEDILRENGYLDQCRVSFRQESFPIRRGDGFRLPSGVYDTLRITIGRGRGHNWWGVLYPGLCQPTAQTFAPDSGKPQIRFYLLDRLGTVRTRLHSKLQESASR